MNNEQLRDLAVDMAREAGALLASRPDDLATETKSSPTDLVTVMDKKAEALIVRRLTERRPGDGILGEEGAAHDSETGVRWIVDPLDGTVNYAYGLPAYSVSIAAEVGAAPHGTVVAGAVFDARTAKVFHAVRGGGAWCETDPLRCRETSDLSQALVATGFSYEAAERARQGQVLAALLPKVANIRRIGSAALELCHVAAGMLDGFFETGLHPWDRAAGLLIAAEAGASVRAEPEQTICAAPGIFRQLAAQL